jgi:NADH:ubiquinone oxidoreductase subunit 6 (subunit J)
LHNDWLETRITFGWVGFSLIIAALVACVARWFAAGGIHGEKFFIMLTWCALGGCLLHAYYDFPFQIHSVLFLFLLIGAVISSLTRYKK